MPLPLFLWGAAAAAGILGAAGHSCARDTNEKAQRLSSRAQDLYNDTKRSLEKAQKRTEDSLLRLGKTKKNVLETAIASFVNSYNKIPEMCEIRLKNSPGLEELRLSPQDVLRLREMSAIYSAGTFASGAGGAAAGLIALAASGSLSALTTTVGAVGTAGTALLAGNIGGAVAAFTGIASAASLSPIGVLLGPALLFSAFSADSKADENYDKARAMYADAERAAEKMKTSQTLLDAITEKADMFSDLLVELCRYYVPCVERLESVADDFAEKTAEKNRRFFGLGRIFGKRIRLSDSEKKLCTAAFSLTCAVKAVIDTPILSKEGKLEAKADEKYQEVKTLMPVLAQKYRMLEA